MEEIYFRAREILRRIRNKGMPFNGKKSGTGGSFVEGVLVEWSTDPSVSDSWEVKDVRRTSVKQDCFRSYVISSGL